MRKRLAFLSLSFLTTPALTLPDTLCLTRTRFCSHRTLDRAIEQRPAACTSPSLVHPWRQHRHRHGVRPCGQSTQHGVRRCWGRLAHVHHCTRSCCYSAGGRQCNQQRGGRSGRWRPKASPWEAAREEEAGAADGWQVGGSPGLVRAGSGGVPACYLHRHNDGQRVRGGVGR